MPDWVIIILLGLIEGITEFLPVSSTGHLLMAGRFFERPQSDLFNIAIQSVTVVAVLAALTRQIKDLYRRRHQPEVQSYVLKLGAAFGITAAGGLMLKAGGFELPGTPMPVLIAFIGGGVIILGVEAWFKDQKVGDEVTWPIAIAVGAAQILSAGFPGLSRAAATIIAGMLFGLNRHRATEFSFLLGIPTLVAAGGVELVDTLRKDGAESIAWGHLVLGLTVSAITAFLAAKWLLHFVRFHTLEVFGWYRIVFGLLMVVVFYLV